jgi:predicted MPP superfamily phosphohydrolase
MAARGNRRKQRAEAPMAYRMQRQARPSLLRAHFWRALQGAAKTLPVPDLELTHLDVPLRRLRRDLDGLTVLHVTDLHLAEGTDHIDRIVDLLGNVRTDITVYTGDLADDEYGYLALTPLMQVLRPRESAFAVLGNHDHYRYRHLSGEGPRPNDVRTLLQVVKSAGVHILINSSATLYDGAVSVIGVDDPTLGLDRVDQAFAAAAPDSAALLLSHSPDVLMRLGRHRPDLLLAGHTHGGQLRLPGIGPIGTVSALPRRYAMGAYVYDGVPTYVSRGVGTSGAPARLNCPPEITLLTLRSPAAARFIA